MMWPFFNRREVRESSLTDALVSQIVANAGGAVSPRPTATGALEACAGLIGRAFSAASVEGPAMLTAPITASVLNLIGRELVRRGEVVFNVDVPVDALQLTPSADWDVQGGFDPEAWLLSLEPWPGLRRLRQSGIVRRPASYILCGLANRRDRGAGCLRSRRLLSPADSQRRPLKRWLTKVQGREGPCCLLPRRATIRP